MKRVFLVLGLVAGTFVANAQISKGKVFLGGEFGINSNTTNDKYVSPVSNTSIPSKSESSNFTISPRVGYAIQNNLVLGIAPTFASVDSKMSINDVKVDELNFKRFGAEVFLRKYVPLVSFASFFAEAGAGYYGTTTKHSYGNIMAADSKTNGKAFNVELRPGVSISLSSVMNLEFKLGSLGYDYSKPDNDAKSDVSNFRFNFNMESARFGVSFFLK